MATYLGLYGDIFAILYFILLMLDRVQTHHSPPIARFRSGLRAHPPTRWSVRIAARRHLRRRGARNPRFLRARGVSDRHREKNGRRPRRPRAHAPRQVPALDRPNRSSLTPIIVLQPSSFMAPGSSSSSRSVLQSVRCSRGSRPRSFGRINTRLTIHPSIAPPRGSPCCAQRLLLRRAALALCESAPGQLFPPRPRAQLSRARRVPGEGDAGRCPACVSPCGGTLAATRRARGTR